MMTAKNIDISIVVPLLNEEEVFPHLIKELTNVLSSLGREYEIMLVDDGSTDRTYELMVDASNKDPRIKLVRFSRNFGHQAAFSAGIDFAEGNMVMTMDGDLQHPPTLIPEFIKGAEEGNDMVIGQRTLNMQNSRSREATGKFAYKLLSFMTGLDFKNISDFNLYNRRVVDVLKKLPERERFMRGMIQWVGFNKKYLPYVVEDRYAGTAKYGFMKLFNLGLSGITSFSAFPLRVSFWAGLLIFVSSILFGIYVIIDHFVGTGSLLPGFATIVILVLFLGSVQLMVLGIVGEYLFKMFNEIKGRPFYIVSNTLNIDRKNIKETPYGIHS
jgi:polyisoprenyl-phosphate glycosyltransferase